MIKMFFFYSRNNKDKDNIKNINTKHLFIFLFYDFISLINKQLKCMKKCNNYY